MNPRYGAPDGHGRYGMITADDDGRLICHECGKTFQQLATHVRLAHGTQPDDYRAAHGLGATTRLAAPAMREKLAAAFERHRDMHVAALESSRDPAAAHAASMRRTEWAPETRARRALARKVNAGRDLTDAEIARLGDPLDIRAWVPHARALLALPDVSTASIARASGISAPTVSQRLRRYPG